MMASTTVQPISYPRSVGLNLRISFECVDKGEEEYLIQSPPGIEPEEVQLGFIADLFDVWNQYAQQPAIVEINGLTHQQIKQRMLGTIL